MRTSFRTTWWLLLLAIWGGRALPADDFSGRVDLFWQTYDSDDFRSDGLVQRYDLRLDRAVAEPLRFRLSLRAVDDDSGSTFRGQDRTANYRELQPGIQFSYVLPTIQFQAGWDELRSKSHGSEAGSRSDRTLDRFAASFAFRPEGLPALVADGRRTEIGDPETGADVTDQIGTLRLEYLWRGLHAGLAGYSAREENRGLGFERRSDDLQATLGWAGSFWNDRLSIAADGLASNQRIDRRALGDADGVPNPVRVIEVYQTYDDTPADDRDHPLVTNPQLHDGDLTRAAGAPLGPEATANLNLALDFGRFARVDEIRVVARNPAGNPVTSGGTVIWDVWASLDREIWTPVASAATRFDAIESFWSVTFPSQQTRYLKVVTFFVNSVPTEATEVQAFERLATVPGGVRRLDLDLVSFTGDIGFRPVAHLLISWNGLFNRRVQTPNDGSEIATRDTDNLLRILWEPRPRTSVELQRQATRGRLSGEASLDQSYDSWLAIARWGPIVNLQTALEAQRAESDNNGERFTTDRVFVHGFVRLWRAIDATLDLGHQTHRSENEGWSISGPQVSGVVHAQLLRSLLLTASASLQENKLSAGAPAGLQVDDRVERYWAEIFWRPSAQLGVGARAGTAKAGGRSTPVRGYRLDWRPFAGGAFTFGAVYDEDVDAAGDRRSRRLVVNPAWQINRRLSLNLNYLRLELDSPQLRQDADSFFAGLTWLF
ncbi:MAG: hypothetical protein U0X73_17770 [Thermoanaerobaculia bacterium]